MAQVVVEEGAIKSLVKEAILELLQERQDLLYDAILDMVEEQALIQAIHEGESTPYASGDEVLQVLEDQGCS